MGFGAKAPNRVDVGGMFRATNRFLLIKYAFWPLPSKKPATRVARQAVIQTSVYLLCPTTQKDVRRIISRMGIIIVFIIDVTCMETASLSSS